MYKEDTIAAIATPPGEGGIAIVRVSGPNAEPIAAAIFARAQGKNGKLESHHLYHGSIRDPRVESVLDEVLLAVMRKPRSYTGEDVVEIHCHGGAFLARRILGVVLAQGARHAEPGEFTMRAFLNGRVDLTQAEAVLDLIRARTDKAVELALRQADGGVSGWIKEVREELLDILAQVEAAIDFPDEDIELLRSTELGEKINRLRRKIFEVASTYDWGRLFREGARVCICGRPNVGKSSLLNALLGEERVIVTPIPGTTRDVIEESINLAGLPVALWDTAGIRETSDQIEKIGVDLSRQHLEKSDAVLLLLDGSMAMTDEDRELVELTSGKKRIIVINKSDLPLEVGHEDITSIASEAEILSVSARTKAGLDLLKESLRTLILGSQAEPQIVLTNLRHKAGLLSSATALARSVQSIRDNQPPEFIAVDLNSAREALEEVIGVINSEDILEHIFINFCIGK